MTTKQLKAEITKALDEMPEVVLNDVLKYLNGLKGMTKEEILRAKRIQRMLNEDASLLRKLAQ